MSWATVRAEQSQFMSLWGPSTECCHGAAWGSCGPKDLDKMISSEELVYVLRVCMCEIHMCMCVCIVHVCMGGWGDGVCTLLGTGETQTFRKKNQRGPKA